MAAEEIFELLDSYWFERGIFNKKATSSPLETNPIVEIQEEEVQESKISSLPTLYVGSMNDQALSCKTSFSTDSLSPDSILATPKLQASHSGKDVIIEFARDGVKQEQKEVEVTMPLNPTVSSERSSRRRTGKKESSKSLSDLEFEELKGFMDLGLYSLRKIKIQAWSPESLGCKD